MKFGRHFISSHLVVAAIGALTSFSAVQAQVPQMISHQGFVKVNGASFNGTGYFRFALVDGAGSAYYWSNDGSSTNGSQLPTTAVPLPVVNGLYSVLLGDTSVTNMPLSIQSSVFANADVRLRVWFDDGVSGVQLLAPDQRVVSTAYTLMAADVADGAIGASKLAPASVTTPAIASAAVGTTQLADAAITPAKLGPSSVTTPAIASAAVGTTQLADGAITPAKLAPSSVTGPSIAAGAVVNSALAADSVTGAKILDGTITDADISSVANINASKIVGGDLQAYRLKVGLNHTLTGDYATIAGGYGNFANNTFDTIGGGYSNNASDNYATIGGGSYNTASVGSSTVAGGANNKATNYYAAVCGGADNTASGERSFIGGGTANYAASAHCVAAGGELNKAIGSWGTVGGGRGNAANGAYSTVPGGHGNFANNVSSTIGGGESNTASSSYATVAGGSGNTASGIYATVCGGFTNTASIGGATVGGGRGNTATGFYSTVPGGYSNVASTNFATIGGGYSNIATGDYATIGGGYGNAAAKSYPNTAEVSSYATIGGGYGNAVRNPFATVPGGASNVASGFYSFAAGRRAYANHHGAFVWGDATDAIAFSTADNEFTARATGGVRFISGINPKGVPIGVYLAPRASQWTSLSDRNAKENFAAVDAREVIEKLAAMPIETWNYKAQDASIRHMGPMAQDFYAAFGLGEDKLGIGTMDADGVAFAALKGLYELVKQKETVIEQLKRQAASQEEELKIQKAELDAFNRHNAALVTDLADMKSQVQQVKAMFKLLNDSAPLTAKLSGSGSFHQP